MLSSCFSEFTSDVDGISMLNLISREGLLFVVQGEECYRPAVLRGEDDEGEADLAGDASSDAQAATLCRSCMVVPNGSDAR